MHPIIEKNLPITIAIVAISAFIAGWTSHNEVQKAANLVTISKDKFEDLEKEAQLGKEDYMQQIELLESKISEMENTESRLRAKLLENKPTSSSYINNIKLLPESPAHLSTKDKITISFDYVIEEGLEANIWIHGVGATSVSPSSVYSGTGTEQLWIRRGTVGAITDIILSIETENQEELYDMSVPVKYDFIQ